MTLSYNNHCYPHQLFVYIIIAMYHSPFDRHYQEITSCIVNIKYLWCTSILPTGRLIAGGHYENIMPEDYAVRSDYRDIPIASKTAYY